MNATTEQSITLHLIDYLDKTHNTYIPLDEIKDLTISVISGDELAKVRLKNGMLVSIDAINETRWNDHLYYQYSPIFNGVWLMDKDKFINRENSYNMMSIDWSKVYQDNNIIIIGEVLEE